MKHTRLEKLLILTLLLVAFGREAAAYTDPGSGALIWQMIVAGIAGLVFYLRQFTTWFRNRSHKE